MKTIRRDWLRKQVEKGAVEMIGSRNFDDMYGQTISENVLPVRINVDNWKDGFCNLYVSDFTTKSGCAYQNETGIITLIIHSNSSLKLRLKVAVK